MFNVKQVQLNSRLSLPLLHACKRILPEYHLPILTDPKHQVSFGWEWKAKQLEGPLSYTSVNPEPFQGNQPVPAPANLFFERRMFVIVVIK